MKKLLCIFSLCFLTSLTVFAHPGCWYGPPPSHYHNPYHYRPGCYYGNSGVALAANIVGLVGATLSLITPPPQPVIVQQPAVVYQQPVVVQQTVPVVQQQTTNTTTIRIIKPDGTQKIITQPTTNTQIYYY